MPWPRFVDIALKKIHDIINKLNKAKYSFHLSMISILNGMAASFIVAGAIYLLINKPSHIWMKKAIAAMRRSH